MKVALYGRVSTERQEKQETIQSQLEALRAYAKKEKYAVIDEYLDEGYSGELLDRPALDKLRDDAKKKLFDAVLAHSPDRLSRNRKNWHIGFLQEELSKNDVRIIFLNRPDSKDTPEDELMGGMQGLIAAYEKTKILERTRRGKLHKAHSGFLIGSIPPYGYRYIPGNRITREFGHYELLETEAKIVKLIFDLFVNGRLSIRSVAKELTYRGIQPRKGKKWGVSSLHRIIRNETYTGITHYNKNISVETENHRSGNKYRRTKNTSRRLRPRDQWVAISLPEGLKIIDKLLFDQALEQLKLNAARSPRNVKYQYLLRGMVRCAKCDAPYTGSPCHDRLYYRCGDKHRKFPLPKECSASMVKASDLESVVWETVSHAIKNPKLIASKVLELEKRASSRKDSGLKDIQAVEKEISSLADEENRLLDAYREQVITIDQLKEQMAKIRDKKTQLEQERSVLASKAANSLSTSQTRRTIKDYCRIISKQIDKKSQTFEGRRDILLRSVNRILLQGKDLRIKLSIPSYQEDNLPAGDIASISS